MGKTAEQIIEIAKKVDDSIEFSIEAAEAMSVIPGPFVKMAIKKTIKRAHEEGVTVVDMAFSDKIRDENFG
ncbi:MAG: hypothetical protein V7711_17140 [Pseudomonadales bacterium]